MKASVVITTRNRRDELERALVSTFNQSANPEVVVVDDGSNDGTSDLVRQRFPKARLFRFEGSRGYIVARNYAARVASNEVIISIDDDAEFASTDIVERTIPAFRKKFVGAVALPYVDFYFGPEVKKQCPGGGAEYVTREFRGTAHAMRRSLFLDVGGYRESLFRQCEEADLCLRLLDRGFVTLLLDVPPIYHFESPRRNRREIHLYGRRNDLLSVWWNYPLAKVPVGLLTATLNGLRTGKHRRCMGTMIVGLAWGYGAIIRHLLERMPVRRETYDVWSLLEGERALSLRQVLPLLAP